MLSHSQISTTLGNIVGVDRAARLKLLDAHDHIRKHGGGITAGDDWLLAQQPVGLLPQVSARTQDESVRRIIEAALQHNDKNKIEWLESRLTKKITSDAIEYAGLTEESIVEQSDTPADRRFLRKKAKQSAWTLAAAVGAIGKDGYHHATPFEIGLRNQQKHRLEGWARDTYLVHKKDIVSMHDLLSEGSKRRLAELYTIAKGIQMHAANERLVATFWTLTAPPQMHSNPSQGRNTWNGTTPVQAQQWIKNNWHRVLGRLGSKTEDIQIAGIRVTEAHRDGCPHWHLMIWVRPDQIDRLGEIIREACPEWEIDAGAREERIDNEKGSACSYLFKYLVKSLSSFDKLEGEHASQDTWRSAWGIRGYQFFGTPALTLWRHFRSLKETPKDKHLAKMWRAARGGRGSDFIALAGGLNIKRKDRPVASKLVVTETTKTLTVFNKLNGFTVIEDQKKWVIKSKDELDQDNQNNCNTLDESQGIAVIPNSPSKPKATPKTTFQNDAVDDMKWVLGFGFGDQYPPTVPISQFYPSFH